ncbi:hypothetical protein SLEP1_g22743 [Rubroshorea leprosula]|uniref:Uncharacterized protein n=1 Tax=Rubroshorea leprosula TaxID=152421 RepID=A0AAV5JKJ2_9ROSI|nr:hypothetical protein SLEP1_g22743 [Rubroshorea leprosula]
MKEIKTRDSIEEIKSWRATPSTLNQRPCPCTLASHQPSAPRPAPSLALHQIPCLSAPESPALCFNHHWQSCPCMPEPSCPPYAPLLHEIPCPCCPALLPAPALLCAPIPCPCLLHATAIQKKTK